MLRSVSARRSLQSERRSTRTGEGACAKPRAAVDRTSIHGLIVVDSPFIDVVRSSRSVRCLRRYIRDHIAKRYVRRLGSLKTMEQSRQLARHGHGRAPLCVLPSAGGDGQAMSAQIAVLSKGPEDVLSGSDQESS